jgi:predicted RNA-binding Zn ribbon-like protein
MFAMNDAEVRDGFSFHAGSSALDLCATLRGRTKPTPHDLLATPRDLRRWLLAAGVVSAAATATDEDLATARTLREAIYAIALACIAGEAPPATARGVLNRVAGGASVKLSLDADGQARVGGTAAALLTSLARDAIRLLGGEEAGRIRQCEGPMCTRLFVDRSRRGDRRWCSMSSCGNRAKVAEFRQRARKGD